MGITKMVPVPAPVTPVASEPYDCNAGYSNWQSGRSVPKKAWCCQNKHMGCVVSEPYDCNAGYSNWQAGWSVPKKKFCCQTMGRGCPPPLATSQPYDCNAGFHNCYQCLIKQWSVGKL